ncbi:ABC transporter ATP-binding protein [Acuticoccus mangrovi]|uniref:ABC transporter ATP-binding protein n=1 Tax=Acuticoccus mangrovi TaxID=2796142 RepID=A0A934MFW5_9HYPH|nr:ABC transporter ATP-binding protein [Acuticoccus mangrovi]
MSEGALIFDNVGKAFGRFEAVKDIAFTVKTHELVSLLGPSGCGKTTVLRLIAGLEMPTSGRILIAGKDVSRVPANGRNIAMVFQSYALFPHMNVIDNVAYGLVAQKVPKREAHERAKRQLEILGLKALEERLPSALSGGQQQRVAVARALVLEPDVLLFDEPLSNLDAKLRRQVREEIRDLQQRLGLTVVYVTHDQSEAMAISDRIIVMRHGRIAQAGAPRALYEAPNSAFVADFMGDANVVGAEVADGVVRLDGLTLTTDLAPGTAVDVVLRPEHMRLVREPGEAMIRGTIHRASYLGAVAEYRVDTPIGALLATDAEHEEVIAEGATVGIAIDPSDARILPRGDEAGLDAADPRL